MPARELLLLSSALFALRRVAVVVRRVLLAVLPLACVLAVLALPERLDGRSRSVAPAAASTVAAEVAEVAAAEPGRQVYSALRRCGSKLSVSESRLIADVIVSESDRHGYDPLFVQALVEVESTCRPTVRSKRGAVGLIQVKPSTARAVAKNAGMAWQGVKALSEPGFNVQIGLRYLAQLEERFRDPYLAVAAYNLGPTQVARMPRRRARESRYVRRVLARYERLLARRPSTAL